MRPRTGSTTILILLCILAITYSPAWSATTVEPKGSFQRIDSIALGIPASETTSIQKLAQTLAKNAETEKDLVRAVFRWITANVDYDTTLLTGSSNYVQGAEQALKSRKSACFGYAELFEALCREAGLEAVTIQGYSKGYRFAVPLALQDKPNHAWNAVKLNGAWQLVDCTWAAGYLDEQGRFIRRFNEHYFLTPPEHFIFDHFPTEERWQLLAQPLTRQQYDQMVLLRPPFFQAGLRVLSHPSSNISASGMFRVRFSSPETSRMMGRLYKSGQQVPPEHVLVQRNTDGLEALVAPPSQGDYTLRFYVNTSSETTQYEWAAEYRVQAGPGTSEDAFPYVFDTFNQKGVTLRSPLHGNLNAGEHTAFSLQIPGAKSVAVVSGSDWSFLSRNSEEWSGKIPLQPGTVQVAAQFDGKQEYDVLLRYQAQ